MRRSILILLLVAAVVPATGAPADAHHRPGPCSIHWHPGGTDSEVYWGARKLLRCATERWSVPGGFDFALQVGHCESGLWPWSNGPAGHPRIRGSVSNPNKGLFQHNITYWAGRVATYLKPTWIARGFPTGIYNPRAQVVITARMVHRGGWGPWSCA